MLTPKLCQMALSMLEGLNPTRKKQLLEAVGNCPEKLFQKDLPDLDETLVSPALKALLADRSLLERADRELEFAQDHQIRISWFLDDDYPKRLKECPDGPLLVYRRGDADLDARRTLAVVGTRRMTAYGKQQTEEILQGLAQVCPDILVVSGLAYGVDSCAHREALRNHLPTVGVLAHGMDRIYPTAHRQLAMEMLENGGGLLSEMPSGTEPFPMRFVQRNRIIAGLSDACLVVESADKGGSLLTAGMAQSYNREVMAIPGRLSDPVSKGCNQLIHKHVASMITSPEDILKLMDWDLPEQIRQGELFSGNPSYDLERLTPAVRELVGWFEDGRDYSVDELCTKYRQQGTDPSMGWLMSNLLQLEMDHVLQSLPGNRYRLDKV